LPLSLLFLEPSSPVVKLIHILREQQSRELVNFDSLSPHLIKQGILSQFEYDDITSRRGYSPIKCFSAVVNEILTKAGKGNVVKKFTQALKDENGHSGHQDLLKIVEQGVTGKYVCSKYIKLIKILNDKAFQATCTMYTIVSIPD